MLDACDNRAFFVSGVKSEVPISYLDLLVIIFISNAVEL